MPYFKFIIPKGTMYSKGWFGEMPLCPDKVSVWLYDDNRGFGIAQTDDIFMPPEVEMISQASADAYIRLAKDIDGVWVGDKLLHRWDEPSPYASIGEEIAKEAFNG